MLARCMLTAAGFVLPLLGSPTAGAQGLEIEHPGIGCVVAGRYVGIDARLTPVESVGRARIYFRASGSADWYFVEMRSAGGAYRGILPQPQRSTRAIDYYLEVIDTDLRPARTAEFRPAVVTGPGACQGGGMALAAALTTAKVVVGAVTRGAALPTGFASGGVTLAGSATATAGAAGGVSTGLVVGLAVAGAAGVGVAVAAGGGGGGGGSPSAPVGTPQTILGIDIGPPGFLDVSACAGSSVTFGGGTLFLRPDGSFDETWSPGTPNTLRLTGRAHPASLQATLSCASRPGPTGSMTASGSNYDLAGSYSFGPAGHALGSPAAVAAGRPAEA